MMNSILTLDLGATVGWAHGFDLEQGGTAYYGTLKFDGDRPRRLSTLYNWAHKVCTMKVIDVVVYERPFCRGMAATRSLWGMAGVVEAAATAAGAAVVDVELNRIKKYTGVKGRTKPLDWARKKGYNIETDHEADALALLHYFLDNAEIVP